MHPPADVLHHSEGFVVCFIVVCLRFFKDLNSLPAGSFTYKLTLAEIRGSTKFKLLYHSRGTVVLVLLFSISFKK